MKGKELIGVKRVGMNGQISIGRNMAGKQVQVFKVDDGTILIQTGKFVPDEKRMEEFFKWMNSTPRRDNYDEIKALVEKRLSEE